MRQDARTSGFHVALLNPDQPNTARRGGGENAGIEILHRSHGDLFKPLGADAVLTESMRERSLNLFGSNAATISQPGNDHVFTQTHCVTGIAVRQPSISGFFPMGLAREIATRVSDPPYVD